MFNVNFTYLINLLLPPILRQLRMISWLKLITSYLKTIYDEYIVLRTIKLFDINFNGQLMYIEKKLQLEFDCNGIYIDDGELIPISYLWNLSENQPPLYIYNIGDPLFEDLFIFNNIEYITEADFVIYIPNNFLLTVTQIQKLRNIVDFYKILEKTYKIEYYNE